MDERVPGDMRATWAAVGERFAAYSLVLPGDASFACLTEACPTHCCRLFSVSLGEAECSRLAVTSGLPRRAFLECDETGEPITLPLAQPYVLARRNGTCALLGPHMLCGQYEGRPDACRLYPHFVLAFDRVTLRPLHREAARIRAAAACCAAGEVDGETAIVLARHNGCPGFGGPALGEAEWQSLVMETVALQYPLAEPGTFETSAGPAG